MTKQDDPVVIIAYARTPMGKFHGCLKHLNATELGSIAIHAAVKRSGVAVESIDATLMGCVLPAGLGQAPARQAALLAGLPVTVECTTINKMCGSGMKAIMLGHDLIKAGSSQIVVAGGMESMSNAPYLLPKVRDGLHMGHAEVIDHMLLDGLEDPQHKRLMGCFAEDCADKYQFSRTQQDEYAEQSLTRAQQAIQDGLFDREIVPVTGTGKNKTLKIAQDEHPLSVDIDRIAQLKPVFKQQGTVTAANASGIADGAAAVVLMSLSMARQLDIKPIARLIGHHTFAQQPEWFTTAPVFAMQKLLQHCNKNIQDIDLFEVNEAFAVVPLAAIHELNLPIKQLNVHGGACALGHPIGASGARIIVTLISALESYDLHRGMASLCIGGGEATAMMVER